MVEVYTKNTARKIFAGVEDSTVKSKSSIVESTDSDVKNEELYQDAVKYPCFPSLGTSNDLNIRRTEDEPDSESAESKLQSLIDIAGGANSKGMYRYVSIDLPALEQKYEIQLGIRATQLLMQSDQDVTIIFNYTSRDNMFLAVGDFPFSISDLKPNEAIDTIYVTTGSVATTFKVFAVGSTKD